MAEGYPELVVRDGKGEIVSVQYHKLVPMLVNELQQQARRIVKLKTRLKRLEAK